EIVEALDLTVGEIGQKIADRVRHALPRAALKLGHVLGFSFDLVVDLLDRGLRGLRNRFIYPRGLGDDLRLCGAAFLERVEIVPRDLLSLLELAPDDLDPPL